MRSFWWRRTERHSIVGFGQMTKGDSRISALYVDPNHLRGGIGSMLLTRLEQEARGLGSTSSGWKPH